MDDFGTEHEVKIALLQKDIEVLNQQVQQLSNDVRELVEAWKAAGTMVSFIKTVAAVVVAVTVLIGAVKYGIAGEAK